MATSSTPPGAPEPTSAGTRVRRPAATRKASTTRKSAPTRRSTTSTSNSTQPTSTVAQVQHIAERVVLVPVGAGLVARDNLVSTVKGIATKYRSRASLERELKRFERRGVTARNRVERQVRKTRTRFEREFRQRRTRVERTVTQNRRRLEREVRSARRDIERQSGVVGARFEKLVAEAQELLGSAV
jgi:hypothetical protein